MEELNNTEVNENDEISLIDLFAVLIRYRKLIVIGTLIVFVISFLYLFILPNIFPSFKSKTQTIRYSLEIKPLPLSISKSIDYDVMNSAIAYMNDPLVINSIQKEFSIFEHYKKTYTFEKNSYTSNTYTDNRISVVFQKVPIAKSNELNLFVQKMAITTSNYIEKIVLPEISQLEKNAELMIEKYNGGLIAFNQNSNNSSTIFSISYDTLLSDIKKFKENYSTFIIFNDNALITSESKDVLKPLIIIVFASLFVFIFIAFLLNSIRNIKQDKYASSLIKNAWEDGK